MRISDWSSDVCSSDLTLIPVLVLIGIAVPSIRLLAKQYDPPKADLTVKVVGHQWYWTYEYPDAGELSFDSVMLSDEDAAKRGDPRLLGVDNRMVVPAGKVVKLLVTADDVIHSWAMPSFWVKMDARSEEHTSELQSLMRTSY